ncbi:MAG: membrane protein insertase YidC [Desulfobulbaceae bacterium]|nr:membrane protein insertase YidC [Desulfobulbaceae bacterium]HIJ79263.1 membrane protein insertase YidC [Deltaproteobacteria bacterium]
METQRIFLAIFLSLAILLGYQYFFVAPLPVVPNNIENQQQDIVAQAPDKLAEKAIVSAAAIINAGGESAAPARVGRDIAIDTALYQAVVSETRGALKSFRLKDYRETIDKDSGDKELLHTSVAEGLPLDFSWGVEPAQAPVAIFEADRESIATAKSGAATLTLKSRQASGLEITKAITFSDQDYLLKVSVDVYNTTDNPVQGAPYMTLTNRSFSGSGGVSSQYVFNGSAVLIDDMLEEINVDDLKGASKSFTGNVGWAAYENNYFLCSVVPEGKGQHTAHFRLTGDDVVTTVLAGVADLVQPGGHLQYNYSVYCGPKKLETLKAVGFDLERTVNFGWFDVVAKPTLYLMNFLYKYLGNYGVAIILVTVIIKLAFWPLTVKGMKSMKTMQKLQPKMAKIREKFKDDKQRQQQEMMKLYQTYKVNPVGGCLPMVAQIPVFFALYKVLLQTIELRHAPFMLWIHDLSAPDRLFIGFDIPMLGGLPVLTLLMGGSMFIQQKMTPSAGDPTQQKVMMFLPVVFTFMFLNFASGLVLYWFINNLLSIGQQYMINRQVD